MAQHDLVVDNGDGATVRNDFNLALQALASMQTGATAPTTTYPLMLWGDSTNGLLKQRNAANNAWLEVGDLNAAGLGILSRIVANMNFKLDNSTPAKVEIGRIEPFISTLTPGSEVGGLRLHSRIVGVVTKLLELGSNLKIFGSAAEVVHTDNGATEGPDFDLIRESVSPAAADILGALRYRFRDSANNLDVGAKVVATLLDPTSTSEDVALELWTVVAGTLAKRVDIRNGLILGSASGGDPGDGKINAKGYLIDGAPLPQKIVAQYYAEYTTNAALGSPIIPNDDTVPTNTEGTQILSVSVTTTSATQKVRARFQGFGEVGTASTRAIAAIFQDSTCVAASMNHVSFTGAPNPIACEVEVVPGSVGTFVFSVRVGPAAGNYRMNGSNTARLLGGAARATLVVDLIEP